MSPAARLLSTLALAILVTPTPVSAHDPGLSSLYLQVQEDGFAATLEIADTDRGGLSLDASALRLEVDGRSARFLSSERLTAPLAHSRLRFHYARPPGTRLRITSARLGELPHGHRQYLRVEDGPDARDGLLRVAVPFLEVDLGAAPRRAAPAALGFFRLGIEHIATGYDHLLFLFALLLVCRGLRPVARIVTTFTVAHSLSLAAATLAWIALPATLVEPAIAASIVVVAALNLARPDRTRERGILIFGFGLIHGLGFAGALAELGLRDAAGGVLVPLASFNLGVEAGQLAIAALVLPLLAAARSSAGFVRHGVPACSGLVGALGLFWLVERLGS